MTARETLEPDLNSGADAGDRRQRSGVVPFLLLLQLLAAAMVVVTVVIGVTRDDSTSGGTGAPTIHEYTVPPGTGLALDLGNDVDFFPRTLEVRVGDQLVIHNQDNRAHTVGPYFVQRDATMRQTFTAPGTLEGLCTIHPSGAVTIVVTA